MIRPRNWGRADLPVKNWTKRAWVERLNLRKAGALHLGTMYGADRRPGWLLESALATRSLHCWKAEFFSAIRMKRSETMGDGPLLRDIRVSVSTACKTKAKGALAGPTAR